MNKLFLRNTLRTTLESRKYKYVVIINLLLLLFLSTAVFTQFFNKNIQSSKTDYAVENTNDVKVEVGNKELIAQLAEEEEILPESPTLISPSTGEDFLSGNPITFSWQAVEGAEQYFLEITGGAITYDFVSPGWIPSTTFTYTNMLDMSNLPYTWRVKARNYYGEGEWSGSRTLTVSQRIPPPSSPLLTSPANSTNFTQGSPITFIWNTSNTATQYLLEISGGGLSAPILNTGWISETSYHFTNTFTVSSQPYQWSVKSRNAAGESSVSTRSFYIIPIPTGCGVPSYTGILLYTDVNCTGTRYAAGSFDLTKLTSPFNNTTKSIYVKTGWSVKIFENKDKTGGKLCISSSQNSLTGLKYNNGSPVIANGSSTISAIRMFQSNNCQ